jgi:hypothetical protein
MEDNEWSFCSMWAERLRPGCGRALANGRLKGDYFFNRADVSGCPDPVTSARQIAKMFWLKGMDCYLYDKDGALAGKGLAQIDTMHVLTAGSGGAAGMTKVVHIDRSLLPAWIDVFCRSFAVPHWKAEVERVMGANFERLELLLSYRGGSPAGCAALYSKKGITGLYCLGTVSQLRGRGLAMDMLKSAKSKGLFLQTLGSERLLPFYEKAGFEVAYTKKIYAVRRSSELKGSKNRAVK